MNIYQYITIIGVILVAILSIWSISSDEWSKYQTKLTYEKYPEMGVYKHNIEQYNKLITQYDSMIKKHKQAIDNLRTTFIYCGETEEETKELKTLQEKCRIICEKYADLLDKRSTEYKERDSFITKHNIRYY